MTVLNEPQVKISKHLGLLKTAGTVAATRSGHWMIYRLIDPTPDFLKANLALFDTEPGLIADTRNLKKLLGSLDDGSPVCRDSEQSPHAH